MVDNEFHFSEHVIMKPADQIASLRKELGMTLSEFAVAIGLSSKGNASVIERTGQCSIKVALAIEGLSGGRIKAACLNAEIAMIDEARAA